MEMKNQGSKLSCGVVLFPLPYMGHLTPMLHLGNALYSRGFSLTIIQTRFNSPDPTEFPNFTFHFIEDALSKGGTAPSDPWEMLQSVKASCLEPFRDSLSRILEDASKGKKPIACLITDPMWEFAGTVAEGFGLPRISLRTGGLLASLVYDSVPLLCKKGYFPILDSRLEEPVQELPPLKVKDLPPEAQHELLAKMITKLKSYCQGIICNTFKELEGSILDRVRENFHNIPVFPIGPLHKYSPTGRGLTQDRSCITWLNTQALNSVLYVSFGTLADITKEQFLEVAWGLAKSKQPFLWVVRPKLVSGSDSSLPEDFLKEVAGRSHIVTRAPQQQVLAHPAIGGFWTHCGWNSTLESICEGVPMICLPFFGDQKMNSRLLSDVLGIGLQLESGLKREEIEMAIRRVMVEKEGREMRERVMVLKEKAQLCLTEGGSSYECLDQLTAYILSFLSGEIRH